MTGTKGVPKGRLLAGYAFVYDIYMLSIVDRTKGVGKHVLCGPTKLCKLGQRVSGTRFVPRCSMSLFSSYQFGE